ncbi:hypothetical protein Tco_0901652 [Tanacetum coccineum]
MRIHEVQTTMLQSMPTTSLNSYGLHALLMTLEADIRTTIVEDNPEQVRLNVLMKLQEAIEEETILEEQILALMHRFADRFTDRRVEINNLMVLHNHPLIDYDLLLVFFIMGWKYGKDAPVLLFNRQWNDYIEWMTKVGSWIDEDMKIDDEPVMFMTVSLEDLKMVY